MNRYFIRKETYAKDELKRMGCVQNNSKKKKKDQTKRDGNLIGFKKSGSESVLIKPEGFILRVA